MVFALLRMDINNPLLMNKPAEQVLTLCSPLVKSPSLHGDALLQHLDVIIEPCGPLVVRILH